jgi:hypothetical protein
MQRQTHKSPPQTAPARRNGPQKPPSPAAPLPAAILPQAPGPHQTNSRGLLPRRQPSLSPQKPRRVRIEPSTERVSPPLNSPTPHPHSHPCTQSVSRSFNSLSRVLFVFPSQYLYSIGLAPLFSLAGSLPRQLELQSQTARLAAARL